MADNLVATQTADFEVVSSAPSVNLKKVGKPIVPIPYSCKTDLGTAGDVSTDVKINGNYVYLESSSCPEVLGDEGGDKKGVSSGTLNGPATPSMSSGTFNVNGSPVMRVGDMHDVQDINTIGKITGGSGSSTTISDEGAIEGETCPPDIDLSFMDSQPSLMEKILSSYMSKPNASSTTGNIGSIMGSPVILHTSQLFVKQEDFLFKSVKSINISRIYKSRTNHMGCMGKEWYFTFEKKFKYISNNTYSLFNSDGNVYDFTYEAKTNSFEDTSNSNISIEQLNTNHFIITYNNSLEKEEYIDSLLVNNYDKNNHKISLNYDTYNKLISISNNLDINLKITYNSANVISSISDDLNRILKYTYDDNLCLSKITNVLNNTKTYTYTCMFESMYNNNTYLLTNIKDYNNNDELNVSYDNDKKILSYKKQEQSYFYSYDYVNNVVYKKDSLDNQSIFVLDKNGYITTIQTKDDLVKEVYNKNTNTIEILKNKKPQSNTLYDEHNRIIQETKNNVLINYAYSNLNPNPVSIVSNNNVEFYTYDEKYNILEKDINSKIYTYTYDEYSNILEYKDANNNIYTYTYNSTSKLLQSYTLNEDICVDYTYDKYNNIIKEVKNNDETTSYTYDLANNLLSINNALNETISYTYDKNANLTSIIDPKEQSTNFTYDEHNRMIQEDKNAKIKTIKYDINNNIISANIHYDTNTNIKYNDNNQILQKKINEHIVFYTYDDTYKLIKIHNNYNDNTLEFQYNRKNKLIAQVQNKIVVNKQYSSQDELVGLKIFDKQIFYESKNNKILNIIDMTSMNNIALNYDDNSNISNIKYANNQIQEYTYDGYNNIKSISTNQTENNYQRDTNHNIININGLEIHYDQTQRIKQYNKEVFTYDKNSNCLNNSSKYNNNNQLISDNNSLYTYDTNYNLEHKISKQTQESTHYTYSLENQLLSYTIKDKNNTITTQIFYTYDDLNRRISKVHNNETYHYVYDNLNIVAILNESKEPLATIIHNQDIDTPLSITNELTKKTYFYHKDANNSVLFLTNINGDVVEDFTYDAYGKIIKHSKDEETFNPYGFTAREFDTNELYYYRFRYYDANTSRFLSLDPIAHESGDFNHYRYVFNNPLNFRDALGLDAGMGGFASNILKQIMQQLFQTNIELETSTPDDVTSQSAKTSKGSDGGASNGSAKEPICKEVWEESSKNSDAICMICALAKCDG